MAGPQRPQTPKPMPVITRPPLRDPISGFPLLPLLGACLIVILALQGLKLLFEAAGGNVSPPTQTTTPRASFLKARETMPASLIPVRRRADPFDHNLILGTTSGALHTVTIFTDPACADCRRSLKRWLADLPMGTQLVYKYWPMNPEDISGGLLQELARRQGTAPAFLQKVDEARDNLTPTQLAQLLEKSGVPIATQHQLLTEQTTDLTTTIGEDIDQARHLELGPPPQILLDTYLMDGTVLHPGKLKTYIERLNRKQPLAQKDDYFLNPGN